MVERVAGIEHARMQALHLAERFGVESIEHLRVEAFARRLNVELVETDIEGAEAQLIVGPDGATIVLPRSLADPVCRRWQIAHELGHFVLRHPAPPTKELCRPRLRRRRRDRRHCEDEANGFAAALLIPDSILATVCDTRPMTLEVPMQLATSCAVPYAAAAQRLMEVTWRTCAIVISQHGVVRTVWPSLSFLIACAGRMWPGERVSCGSLAGRFFETGELCDAPALVPASTWLADVDPEVRLQEHSVPLADHNAVATMLWHPAESVVPRPAEATLRAMAISRDYMLGEVEENPQLRLDRTHRPRIALLSST